jgi:hypothetical protein
MGVSPEKSMGQTPCSQIDLDISFNLLLGLMNQQCSCGSIGRPPFCLFSSVLAPFIESDNVCDLCLVLDSLLSYKTPHVLGRFCELNLCAIFITGGLTPYVQPLNMGVNAPFKHWFRKAWADTEPRVDTSPSERRSAVSQLILCVWDSVAEDTVINSITKMLAETGLGIMDYEEAEIAGESQRVQIGDDSPFFSI